MNCIYTHNASRIRMEKDQDYCGCDKANWTPCPCPTVQAHLVAAVYHSRHSDRSPRLTSDHRCCRWMLADARVSCEEFGNQKSCYNGTTLYSFNNCIWISTLHWRHNDHGGVSNHQPRAFLLNCLFGRRSKKTSNLRVAGLCVGNSPGTGEFPAQMASNEENDSNWWRHHGSRHSDRSPRLTIDHRFCRRMVADARVSCEEFGNQSSCYIV